MSKNSFNPYKIPKNEKVFGYIDVVDNVSARYNMPVGVVNGVKEGPTLVVTGGLYPTEYYGLESAGRLYQEIDPTKLEGKFIAILCINTYGLQFRGPIKLISTGRNPVDMLNINNSFPGDEKGKPSQVNAKRVYDILSKADYHIDFRGGDLNESHLQHTIYDILGSEIDEVAETMAKVAGYKYVLPGTPEIGHTRPGTMIYETMKAGCASIITEAGLGYREQPLERYIQAHIDATYNIMKHFGMIEGVPVKPESQHFLDMEWVRVPAPGPGIFIAHADHGDILKEGQVIGLIKGLDGSILHEVKSPIDGIVHTMYPRRVVHAWDGLYTLLRIAEETGYV
jgi:predicted deacylase